MIEQFFWTHLLMLAIGFWLGLYRAQMIAKKIAKKHGMSI